MSNLVEGPFLQTFTRSSSQSPKSIWAIGGGKGGVGKSFISTSLALCLTKMGKSVTLVDLDLGGANLHTCLGGKIPELSLSDFFAGRLSNFNQIISETDIPGLRFVSGFNDALNVANLSPEAKLHLMEGIRSIQSPHIILDLGAGTLESTIDFFLMADQKIVVVTPEPTSIENAYRFIKTSYYYKLRQSESELGIQKIIESAMDARNQNSIRTPSDLIEYIAHAEPNAGARLIEKMSDFQLHFLLNQVRTRQDIDLGYSMKSVCRKYFGIETNYLGYIDHDNAVWQSLRKRRPLVIEYPYSSIVGQFLGVTKNLLNPHLLRAVI